LRPLRAFDWVRTGGKGYMESPEDGIFYSYSLFSDLGLIRKHCRKVRFFATEQAGSNLRWTAGHVALLAEKVRE
jgi:hypothetical protein